LEIEGVILSDQIKNMDFATRNAVFICHAPQSVVEKVQKNVWALIG
jgi:mRNA-degrading endonuclease toxin of MazEF toxin-antitoxin module